MSYLYTPSSTWASSVTIPADSDAGRASGELATSIRTIADRNAWLAGQVVHETYNVRRILLPSTVSYEYPYTFNHEWCPITINTSGFSTTIVVASIIPYAGSTTADHDFFLVVNGDITTQTTAKITASCPYGGAATEAVLFGATTVQSSSMQCCVYTWGTGLGVTPRLEKGLCVTRFDIYKVRS